MTNPQQLDDEINNEPVDQVIADLSDEDMLTEVSLSGNLNDDSVGIETSPDADNVGPGNKVHPGVDEGAE